MKKGIIEYCNDKGLNLDEYVDELKNKIEYFKVSRQNLEAENRDLVEQVQKLLAKPELSTEGVNRIIKAVKFGLGIKETE